MALKKPINIEIEQKRFIAKARNLSKKQGIPLNNLLRLGVVYFTQSAVKAAKPKGRRTTEFTLRGEEEQVKKPTLRSRGIIKQQDHGDKKFRVPFRTKNKKGSLYFKTKSAANKAAKINYRFVGKFGWLIAGQTALKKTIPVKLKVTDFVRRLGNRAGWGVFKKRLLKQFFMVVNTAQRIGDYDRASEAIALRKAKSRMNIEIRKAKGDYAKLWR